MRHRTALVGRPMIVASLALGVALSGVTPASASQSAAGSAAVRLGPYGYGALKLGMSAKRAQKTGKIVKKPGDMNCSAWDLKAHPTGRHGVGLFISRKRGVAVIFAPKGVRTPEGVGIGSTTGQLRRAYPRLKTAAAGYPVATVPGNGKAYYAFLLSGGRVKQLALKLKTQDCVN